MPVSCSWIIKECIDTDLTIQENKLKSYFDLQISEVIISIIDLFDGRSAFISIENKFNLK